jgi:N6-L-threonylcarbamoyladenine synthase
MDDAVVLGIETSCDETAAALVRGGREVLASRVHSQVDLHAAWGGVVPELASRDHLARLLPVVDAALEDAALRLEDVDCIAVTSGPGLIGALLVGVQTAKGLAAATGRPLVGVNHLEGHLAAVALEPDPPEAPYLGLIVSGGHTSLYRVEGERPPRYAVLGRTRDDAAGEAFDKIARLLGLPYPGGKALDERARGGDPAAFRFPRGMRGKGLDFSFSGLKTSVRQHVEAHGVPTGQAFSDLCASVQEAIVDSLVEKSLAAARETGLRRLVVSGGVAANGRLRARLEDAARAAGVRVWIPSLSLCTDNAAMIAAAGHRRFVAGERAGLDLEPDPAWSLG